MAEMAEQGRSLILLITTMLSLSMVPIGQSASSFRAFYFVQQWLGSYCNQAGTRCCYLDTGKAPADFTIQGLWPYLSDGSFPYNCGGGNFDVGIIKPIEKQLHQTWPTYTCPLIGRKFWVHEWNKHGTCTKSFMNELTYFNSAINMKKRVNILQALARAGIRPNNQFYPIKSIKQAIRRATGLRPWIVCNHNAQGHSQIWMVTTCVDATGKRAINCPYIPKGRGRGCANRIQFPSF